VRNRNHLNQRNETELNSSSTTSDYRRVIDPEAFAGAHEGILAVLDDPRMAGRKQYCSKTVETEEWMHAEDTPVVCPDLESRSLKVSVFKDSCA